MKFAVLKGFSRYQIYENGSIFNTTTQKFMRVQDDGKDGYLKIKFTNDKGVRVHWWLNRLVYTAFYGKIPAGLQIDHNDGERLNNHIENLSSATPKQNNGRKRQREKSLFSRSHKQKRKGA